jgi:hypothetical protein
MTLIAGQGDVVSSASGGVIRDHCYRASDHDFAELLKLTPVALEARYLGVREAFDALQRAVSDHNQQLRSRHLETSADALLDKVNEIVDTSLRGVVERRDLGPLRELPTSDRSQRLIVSIISLQSGFHRLTRAIDNHHAAFGSSQDGGDELCEIDQQLWASPVTIGGRFLVDIDLRVIDD